LFIDPADTVLGELAPFTSDGRGLTHCIATETQDLTLDAFNQALQALGTPHRASLKHQVHATAQPLT
jgi:glutamate racemase